MDFDGKNTKKLYSLQKVTNSICLSKDWVFFLDSNDNSGMMELISTDGKQKKNLYTLNYSDYYYMDELIEESKNVENTTIENTVENEISRRSK